MKSDQQLRYFIAIARAGSVRGAAENLRICQPALSKQLRQLELELDALLFRRHGRGMALTDAGKQLYDKVSGSFDEVDLAIADLAREASAVHGKLTIAAVKTLATYLVPDMVAQLQAMYPTLQIAILTDSSPGIVELVERGYADVGLLYDVSVTTNTLTVRRLHHEVLSAYCTRLPNGVSNIGIAELAQARLILPPRPYALRRFIEREVPGCKAAIEVDSITMGLDLAARGLGMAILPLHLPDVMIAPRKLERIHIMQGGLSRPIAAVHRVSAMAGSLMHNALEIAQRLSEQLETTTFTKQRMLTFTA